MKIIDLKIKKVSEIECHHCKKIVYKHPSEIRRNEKNNSKNFCSLSCNAIERNKNRDYSKTNYSLRIPAPNFIKKSDEFSGFRVFIRRIKTRCLNNNEVFELDINFLKELWEKQKGKCVYTNIDLELPVYNVKGDKIYTASIDRKNSKEGYTRNNIQFVSTAINYMKNDMTHEKTIELCNLIALKYIKD